MTLPERLQLEEDAKTAKTRQPVDLEWLLDHYKNRAAPPSQRIETLTTLVEHLSPEELGELVAAEALEPDTHSALCVAIIRLTSKMDRPTALELLEGLMGAVHRAIPVAAMEEYVALGGRREGMEPLFELANSRHFSEVIEASIKAIGELGERQDIPALRKAGSKGVIRQRWVQPLTDAAEAKIVARYGLTELSGNLAVSEPGDGGMSIASDGGELSEAEE